MEQFGCSMTEYEDAIANKLTVRSLLNNSNIIDI